MARITTVALVLAALLLAPPAYAQQQTQSTSSYKVAVELGPPAAMLMPDQAKPGLIGEVMAAMPGMPMPTMDMMNQGNHHLEVHIYSNATGVLVTDALPSITWQNQASGQSGSVSPVMAMYDNMVGKSDWHYGGNINVPSGMYTVTVTVGSEKATIMGVMAMGPVAAPVQAPMTVPMSAA